MGQTGCILKHRETEKPALWLTVYNEKWAKKEDKNIFRIRSHEDLPSVFPIDLKELNIPRYFAESNKKELYFYLSAFFTKKEDREDFILFFLPSGFPKHNQEDPK